MSADEFGHWRVMASEEWMNGEEDFMRWAARQMMAVVANGLYNRPGRPLAEADFARDPWSAPVDEPTAPLSAEQLKNQIKGLMS